MLTSALIAPCFLLSNILLFMCRYDSCIEKYNIIKTLWNMSIELWAEISFGLTVPRKFTRIRPTEHV